MKKIFTFSISYFFPAVCWLLIIWVSTPDLFAQQTAGNNGFLFRISEGLKSPVRIALDDDGVVYVTDAFRKEIVKFDTSGQFLGTVNSGGFPLALAVNDDKQLVVSDNKVGAIKKFDFNGGDSEIYTNCTYPSDAVFDGDNKLYVVDSKQKQVIVMDLSGNVIRTFGSDVMAYPTGIAYDRKNARILVAEHGGTVSGLDATENGITAKVLVFDTKGNLLNTFGEFGFEDGQLTRIQGLAVDNRGRVYVLDNLLGTVNIFDENGSFITKFGEFGTEPGQLSAPMDIAIDSRNRIWITSMNNGSIDVFSAKAGGLDDPNENLPVSSDLLQNYPNPFREGTWIPFILAVDEEVTIKIYNLKGTIVRTFNPGLLKKGNYTDNGRALFWDGNSDDGQPVGNGIYFYELKLKDSRKVRRMIFLK
ncbi:MAG: 6-bladed beta-propeller [Chlorobi bacterium]|nr:6-bladed beta-propeller [Chlorobiota bacterium]